MPFLKTCLLEAKYCSIRLPQIVFTFFLVEEDPEVKCVL